MKRKSLTLVVGILLLIVFGLLLFMFQVRTTEVAVVTTFGRPTRDVSAGAHFKWPWPMQKVHKFDQRIHNFESPFEQVMTSDGFNLLMMVYVGWNIVDPKLFFPAFDGSVSKARESLEGLVRNAYSGVVGQHPFSHFISTDAEELRFVEIENEMLERVQAAARANNYGIDIRFLGIKKLGLPESVTRTVFEQMRSERQVLISEIQSEGERRAAEIRSGADLESARILNDAEAQATRIRSEGQKAAAESFKVFEQNPELANFILKLNALEAFLKERSTLILDASTSPLDLLRAAPTAPELKKTSE